jgi:flagellar protein FliL
LEPVAMAKKPRKPDADPEEGGEAATAKKGRIAGLLKNKLALGGVALLLALAGGGFTAMKMGLFGGRAKDEAAAQMEKKPNGEAKPVHFVDLPEMLVNLDSKDHSQYLKVKISLEVSEAKAAEDIKPLMPRVLDTFQSYMRVLRPSDLEGSAGFFRLKEELTKRVNVAVSPAKVDAVVFQQIVVQ